MCIKWDNQRCEMDECKVLPKVESLQTTASECPDKNLVLKQALHICSQEPEKQLRHWSPLGS